MKKIHLLYISLFAITLIISCSKNEDENYTPIDGESKQSLNNNITAPIILDLAQVPFPNLSDYHFFVGEMKLQKPGYKVIPYEPASSLFTDYAHKKRFVWMPKGTQATYNGDDNVFEFPVGTVLIKTFYYDNVQSIYNSPVNNESRIIETRLLVRKADGWKAYEYVWNEAQTDATLETTDNGLFVPLTFTENSITRTIDYKVPAQTECATCHKINPNETGEIMIPIGPKPQNLNTLFTYSHGIKNQITRWKNAGYLGNDVPALNTIHSTVDYKDLTKSLESRARSYIDINCAHCHRDGGHCAYTPQRFNFSNSDMYTFGLCLPPLFTISDSPFVINGGDAEHSELISRINTNEGSIMMPLIGRSIIHEEGVQLMTDYINSLPSNCH